MASLAVLDTEEMKRNIQTPPVFWSMVPETGGGVRIAMNLVAGVFCNYVSYGK
jgi:hypothetical protein